MRNILTAVLGLAMAASVAQAGPLTLWVTKDAGTPGTPAVLTDVQVGEVLTLWAAGTTGDKWIGITFDLLDTGDGNMSNDELLFPGSGLRRWEGESDLTGSSIGLVAVSSQGLNIGNALDPLIGGAAKLGTITANAGTGLLQGLVGFARQGATAGEDTITAGETSFASDDRSTVATLWTPEPASLVLIALAGLAIRRR